MSDFSKALMITAVPIAVLSVASQVGAIVVGGGLDAIGFLFVWLVPAFLLLIAIAFAIINTVKGREKIAAGIWAGIGIGIVSLGLSCFALWQTVN